MSEPIPSPERFGRYTVHERIGAGGMATVHRATKHGIAGYERVVALKRMLSHLAENPAFVESFVREAKVASLLTHPNIGQIFDFGRIDGVYYIAMELIDGVDLRRVLRAAARSGRPIPLGVVISLLAELCDALDYAHTFVDAEGNALDIVHRDVSPSNLLIASTGHLKVIDFGIAKASARQLHTESGQVKGKLGYMSPEATTGAVLGPVSDIFSVGVIAYELLALTPLFSSKTDFETMLKIREGEIRPPSERNPRCPPALDELVLAALERDPYARLPNAAALRAGLDAVVAEHELRLSAREVAEWLGSVGLLGGAATARHAASRTGAFSSATGFTVTGSARPAAPRTVTRSGPIPMAAASAPSADSSGLSAAEAWGDGSEPQLPAQLPRERGAHLPLPPPPATRVEAPYGAAPPALAPPPAVLPAAPARRWRWPALVALVAIAGGLALYLALRGGSADDPRTAIKFAIEPAGAIIEVGGNELGRAPFEAQLAPGVYSIHIHSPGYVAHRTSLTLRAGEVQHVSLALEPAARAAPAGSGGAPALPPVAGPAPTAPAPTAPEIPADPEPTPGARERRAPRPVGPRGAADPSDRSVTAAPLPAEPGRKRPPGTERTPPRVRPAPPAEEPEIVDDAPPPAPAPTPPRDPAPPATPAPAPVVAPPPPPEVRSPPRPARIPLVSPQAVTKVSGSIPRVTADDAEPASVVAKVCIDTRGRVTEVKLRAAPDVARQLEAALKTWQYRPYQSAAGGAPEPACFPVTLTLTKR